MGYNLKRLDPEIVKRHIAILELKESGLGYGAIGRKLSLKIGTVSNTINNHGGKLAELREVLRQFEKSIGESGFGSVVVAKANQNGSKVEVATSNQEEIVGVEQVNRSDQEQVKLWTNLLKSICFNGFSMTKEWQVEMVEKLGLASTDELVEMLEMLAERGYLVKYEVEVEGEERDVFYQVSFDGRPYAKGEEIIEVCINNGEDGSNLVEEAVRDTVPKGESADPEVDLFRFLSQININGSLRLVDTSYHILESVLGISDTQRENFMKDAIAKRFLEPNERGFLVITETGRAYLTSQIGTELQIVAERADGSFFELEEHKEIKRVGEMAG